MKYVVQDSTLFIGGFLISKGTPVTSTNKTDHDHFDILENIADSEIKHGQSDNIKLL
jgi:hypothetical protein